MIHSKKEVLFYPCVADANGRILKKVGAKTQHDEAVNHLKKHYYLKWTAFEAIPQPEFVEGLHD